jgi:hypothetical protein
MSHLGSKNDDKWTAGHRGFTSPHVRSQILTVAAPIDADDIVNLTMTGTAFRNFRSLERSAALDLAGIWAVHRIEVAQSWRLVGLS